MKYLYLALAKLIQDKLPEIKHIDLYNGQYLEDGEENDHPYNVPAIFIDFGEIPWDTLGNGTQEGLAMISLHLVTDNYDDTFQTDNPAIPPVPVAGLAFMEVADRIQEELQGESNDVTLGNGVILPVHGPLIKRNSFHDTSHGTINVMKIMYQSSVFDYSAWVGFKKVKTEFTLKLTGTIAGN